MDEKLRQLNRLGFEQLDSLIVHQIDGKIGAKFRDGYQVFTRQFQQPLLEAMDYCRKMKLDTTNTALQKDDFHKIINELRINLNTLVPQMELLQMKELLLAMKQNDNKLCQIEKLDEITEQLSKIKKELMEEVPSYLTDFSPIERAEEEIKILAEQNANNGHIEIEKVLQILAKLILEFDLDILLNEFNANISTTNNVNVLSKIGHKFIEEWHTISAKIVSENAEYPGIEKELEQKINNLLIMEHEILTTKFANIMENLLNVAKRNANTTMPKNALELYKILKNDYLNDANLREYHANTRAIIEEAFQMLIKQKEEKKIDQIEEQKINSDNE
ncbi:hypothetical protein niasHS_004865 [Heterodera schachtii]|uniref:Uncharacterized protein n=1 Tax=Heterodera schachtii TaxID=97005 RepID=A0ABD2JLF8_HETSC